MIFFDLGAAQDLMEMRAAAAQRAYEKRILSKGVGDPRPGWLRFKGARLLKQAGRQLVVLGERLEQRSAPQPSSLWVR